MVRRIAVDFAQARILYTTTSAFLHLALSYSLTPFPPSNPDIFRVGGWADKNNQLSQASIVLSKRQPVTPSIASQPHCGKAEGAELGETRGGQQPQPQQQPNVKDGPRSTAAVAAQHEREDGCHLQQRAEESKRGWAEDERVRLPPQQGQQQSQQQPRGVWHQLVCARFAGLKGCDSLAS